jgi:hypothetical protein
MFGWNRHCEERSDEAIHLPTDGLRRSARNDDPDAIPRPTDRSISPLPFRETLVYPAA